MITPGKKALAIKGFAQALRNMPGIIADNAGYDSSELVTQLQAAHANGEVRAAQGGGRSVALPCRSSTSYQLPDSLTCSAPLVLKRQCDRTLGPLRAGHGQRQGRKHGGDRYRGVLQAEAAGPTLVVRGRGADPPGGRNHQMCAAAKGAGLLNTTLCEKYNELYSTSRQQRAHIRKGALKRVGERARRPTLAATSCLWQPLQRVGRVVCLGGGGLRPSSTARLSCTPSSRSARGVLQLGTDDRCAPAGCSRAPSCAPPREMSAARQPCRQGWPRGDEPAGGGAAGVCIECAAICTASKMPGRCSPAHCRGCSRSVSVAPAPPPSPGRQCHFDRK